MFKTCAVLVNLVKELHTLQDQRLQVQKHDIHSNIIELELLESHLTP